MLLPCSDASSRPPREDLSPVSIVVPMRSAVDGEVRHFTTNFDRTRHTVVTRHSANKTTSAMSNFCTDYPWLLNEKFLFFDVIATYDLQFYVLLVPIPLQMSLSDLCEIQDFWVDRGNQLPPTQAWFVPRSMCTGTYSRCIPRVYNHRGLRGTLLNSQTKNWC